jgi:hypothetical protein
MNPDSMNPDAMNSAAETADVMTQQDTTSQHMTMQDLCRDCEAMVAAARQSLAEGAILDLRGLDAQVERVCAGIATLPRGERKPMQAALQRLTAELDRLAAAVTAQQAALREAAERTARGRATQAYQTRTDIAQSEG